MEDQGPMSLAGIDPTGLQLQGSGPQTSASTTSAEPPASSPQASPLFPSPDHVPSLFAEYAGLFKSTNDREYIGIGEASSLGILRGLPLPLRLTAILKRAAGPEYE